MTLYEECQFKIMKIYKNLLVLTQNDKFIELHNILFIKVNCVIKMYSQNFKTNTCLTQYIRKLNFKCTY